MRKSGTDIFNRKRVSHFLNGEVIYTCAFNLYLLNYKSDSIRLNIYVHVNTNMYICTVYMEMTYYGDHSVFINIYMYMYMYM